MSDVHVSTRLQDVVLETRVLRVEVTLRPFSFVIRRAGRSLLRAGGAWAVDGEIRDQFLQFTEGVLADEQRAPVQRAVAASPQGRSERGLTLSLRLEGGRGAQLAIELPCEDRVSLALTAEGAPLRLGLDWERRAEERLVGLGLRHHPRLDQAGRDIQLGADRRYTGPDCPAEMLAEGGIPQGDCAPVPWLLSSRGYGVWCGGDGNGTCFDLAGERISVSTRAHAGPLTLQFVCGRTPAARLRELCRLTGFPAQLPDWGYGFWKSRDVHEHQDDVLDDFLGFRRHRIPLDAIVIDSPWATQYNTWEFNPHQFPDAAWMISSMRADGVRTVVWVTPWVNLDSRNGQIAPQPESERLHSQPASNYAPAAAAGHFVREADGRPFVSQWWMGTGLAGRFLKPGGGALVAGVGQAGPRAGGGGDQGRRRRWLLHPRPRQAGRRTHRSAGGVGAGWPAPPVPAAGTR